MKKKSQTDYTRSMLPQTRKAVFFDVVQLQWRALVLLGFILLMGYIPLLLSNVIGDLSVAAAYRATETAEQAAKAAQGAVYTHVLLSMINIPLSVVFCLGLSAVLRPLRQFAWLENVHLPTDLPRGIRDNFLHTAALGALTGVIYTLCLMAYYNAAAAESLLSGILQLLPAGFSVLVVAPVFAIALMMIPVYTNKLWPTLKNAFVVYTKTAPRTLGFGLLCLLIWVPSLIPNFYCHIFGSVFACLASPFALLAWMLFCFDRFDAHINPLVSPELIGKGTFPDQ